MWAIKPKGVGKRVGARRIKPNWSLTDSETFKVNEFDESLVLAEDGVSLRPGTVQELAPPVPDPSLEDALIEAGIITKETLKSSRDTIKSR